MSWENKQLLYSKQLVLRWRRRWWWTEEGTDAERNCPVATPLFREEMWVISDEPRRPNLVNWVCVWAGLNERQINKSPELGWFLSIKEFLGRKQLFSNQFCNQMNPSTITQNPTTTINQTHILAKILARLKQIHFHPPNSHRQSTESSARSLPLGARCV